MLCFCYSCSTCSCLVDKLANTGRRGHTALQLIRQPHVIIEEETTTPTVASPPVVGENFTSLSSHPLQTSSFITASNGEPLCNGDPQNSGEQTSINQIITNDLRQLLSVLRIFVENI